MQYFSPLRRQLSVPKNQSRFPPSRHRTASGTFYVYAPGITTEQVSPLRLIGLVPVPHRETVISTHKHTHRRLNSVTGEISVITETWTFSVLGVCVCARVVIRQRAWCGSAVCFRDFGRHVDQKEFLSKPSTPNAKSKLLAKRHHSEADR